MRQRRLVACATSCFQGGDQAIPSRQQTRDEQSPSVFSGMIFTHPGEPRRVEMVARPRGIVHRSLMSASQRARIALSARMRFIEGVKLKNARLRRRQDVFE